MVRKFVPYPIVVLVTGITLAVADAAGLGTLASYAVLAVVGAPTVAVLVAFSEGVSLRALAPRRRR
jgi:hypothetical protein